MSSTRPISLPEKKLTLKDLEKKYCKPVAIVRPFRHNEEQQQQQQQAVRRGYRTIPDQQQPLRLPHSLPVALQMLPAAMVNAYVYSRVSPPEWQARTIALRLVVAAVAVAAAAAAVVAAAAAVVAAAAIVSAAAAAPAAPEFDGGEPRSPPPAAEYYAGDPS
ncbi:ecdysone-induced protein 74EF-like [Prorops nasuta]|uniref:ecdysone-induced protein 74EF-like n=1 Tax=Prorops nasuta TaxID=863751 RepID=UPI0034CF8329